MIFLEVKNLTKSFQYRSADGKKGVLKAVDDVSFSLAKGETLGIVGESGSGKSTTGRCILGLIRRDSGDVLYEGESVTPSNVKKYRRKMQLVFQNPAASLDPKMKCDAIIEEGIRKRANKEEKKKRIQELAEMVGLTAELLEKYPHELSGGQQQRVCIARALAVEPELIICDEPVSSLDVSYQARIINLLLDLKKEKKLSYLFISHDLSVIECISDKIAVMFSGRVVEYGTKDDIIKAPSHPYTRALISAVPVIDIDKSANKEYKLLDMTTQSPSEGCPFYTRCRHAEKICSEKKPTMQEVMPGHFCECHFAGKI